MRKALVETGVTAVAAYDDETALIVLQSLGRLGLRCPADVAVIGFDDLPAGALWDPALTTVRVDAERYGRRAARIALGLEPQEWTTPPSTVVVRASA